MKYKLATTCFVIGSVLAPVAAYAADSDTDRSNPANFVKDSVITTKIKTKLAAEHLGSTTHIQVDTDKNGIVWTHGAAGGGPGVARPGGGWWRSPALPGRGCE
jgi:hyperosmotically inducible protein